MMDLIKQFYCFNKLLNEQAGKQGLMMQNYKGVSHFTLPATNQPPPFAKQELNLNRIGQLSHRSFIAPPVCAANIVKV